MFKFQRKLKPPADVNDYVHTHGQANPIRHYRLGLNCDCNILNIPKILKTDCTQTNCMKEHTQERLTLKNVRNSGGSVKKQTKSNSEYLKAKSMTYDQKKFHYHKSDEDTKINRYQCANGVDSDCCTIWKPSNKYYLQDGAVSGSNYTHRVKYNNIQSAAASLSNFDQTTVSAHAYSSRTAAPFTLKSKTQPPMCGLFKKVGTKIICK
tara:strand:+ start:733 stop:1356 length:624 start_codon:yes stop_codon:yes gene_type:complete